jgi:hypothetical protein
MARAQHKLSRRALLGGVCRGVVAPGEGVTGVNPVTRRTGSLGCSLSPRRPALRVSRRTATLLRKAGLRLGASG